MTNEKELIELEEQNILFEEFRNHDAQNILFKEFLEKSDKQLEY